MSFIKERLVELENAHLRRELRRGEPGRVIDLAGQELVNFSSNNYLGLAKHPVLIKAAREALEAGTGAGASRLVTGNTKLHEDLEAELAALHHQPAARLFNSGYQTNLGLISSMAGPEDVIVSDRLNHASVIDGCRLSRAAIRVAEHANASSFREHLQGASSARRRFVITDSVFSMDGDLAPLADLREICDQHGAMLIVDEAHAVGALGPGGAGICAQVGVVPDALVGGLGKAFGSYGGYVAASSEICEYLLNQARSFVFSTALPPAVVAANLAALRLLRGETGQGIREGLAHRIEQLSAGLAEIGLLEPGAGQSSIFPIIIGDAAEAVAASLKLQDAGVFCLAIRPPTVERGRSRLRIALSALHSADDIDLLLRALSELRLSA